MWLLLFHLTEQILYLKKKKKLVQMDTRGANRQPTEK